jgi:hypothetical protein
MEKTRAPPTRRTPSSFPFYHSSGDWLDLQNHPRELGCRSGRPTVSCKSRLPEVRVGTSETAGFSPEQTPETFAPPNCSSLLSLRIFRNPSLLPPKPAMSVLGLSALLLSTILGLSGGAKDDSNASSNQPATIYIRMESGPFLRGRRSGTRSRNWE